MPTYEDWAAPYNSPQAAQAWQDWLRAHPDPFPNFGKGAAGSVPLPGQGQAPVRVEPPAAGIPETNRGQKAQVATGECVRGFCIPTITGAPSNTCLCWSDIIVYTAAGLMVWFGAWSITHR